MEAAALFRTGFSPAQVAHQFNVSCQGACRWYRAWEQEGAGGLRAAGRAGRLPRIDDRQWREVERALLEGPRSFGHSSDLLAHRFNWKRVSMAGALAYRWDGGQARLYFQTRTENYNDERLIEFIRQLRQHFRGKQVILLWDGLPSHRSARMKEFLARQKFWLEVERLPAYAPELNPAEGLWANLKGRELANLCENEVEGVERAAGQGVRRVRRCRDLLFGFLRHAGLDL